MRSLLGRRDLLGLAYALRQLVNLRVPRLALHLAHRVSYHSEREQAGDGHLRRENKQVTICAMEVREFYALNGSVC